MTTQSQTARILRHLLWRGRITPLEALRRFGCLRLGARIYDLRRDGWRIDAIMVKTRNGKRVASYSICG